MFPADLFSLQFHLLIIQIMNKYTKYKSKIYIIQPESYIYNAYILLWMKIDFRCTSTIELLSEYKYKK